MANEVAIQHTHDTHDDEQESVRALVRTVANETFSELFALNPVPLGLEEDDWSLWWVGGCQRVPDCRCDAHASGFARRPLGASETPETRDWKLAQGESEIAARGYEKSRLRVVKSICALNTSYEV
jgi:hypothetical protein